MNREWGPVMPIASGDGCVTERLAWWVMRRSYPAYTRFVYLDVKSTYDDGFLDSPTMYTYVGRDVRLSFSSRAVRR